MKNRMLWIGLTALAVALIASTGAFAAQHRSGTSPRPAAASGLGGVCGALMRDPGALKDMQALRGEHLADMKAWRAQYGADPTSPAARAALDKLRAEHMDDMRALLQGRGLRSGTWSRRSMMGGSSTPGGMMGGLGGGNGSGYGNDYGMMGSY
jgi:hypothetical protein